MFSQFVLKEELPEPHVRCEGVRLRPFPSDSLETQSYDFDEIAHMETCKVTWTMHVQ